MLRLDIKLRMLIPLVACIAIIVSVSISGLRWMQCIQLDARLGDSIRDSVTDLRRNLSSRESNLHRIAEFVQFDAELCSALKSGKADALRTRTGLLVKQIPSVSALNEFVILDQNGKPVFEYRPRFNSQCRENDASAIAKASATGKPVSGISICQCAELESELIVPWVVDSKTIGFIKLAESLDRAFDEVRERKSCEAVVLVDKSRIDHNDWIAAEKQRTDAQWNAIRSDVAIMGEKPLPASIVEKLNAGELFSVPQRVEDGYRKLLVAALPVFDIDSKSIGRLLLIDDVSDVVGAANRLTGEISLSAALLAVLLCALMYVVIQRLQVGIHSSQSRLEHEAMHDTLTGLANRRLFVEKVRAVLRRNRECGGTCAVLFIDFDRFKLINDSLGHEVGDLLLQSISKRLTESVRPNDLVASGAQVNVTARLGGDEFCILLEDLRSGIDSLRVAERLLKQLSKPHYIKGQEVLSTASIGVTTSELGYDSAEDMIRDADTAMYRAKSAGKARCVVFDQRMHEEAVARLLMESEMPRALETGEFVLYYQPIVSLEDGSLVGMEALCRWEHPRLGVVSPTDFIPVAEETGHIVAIGNWVIEDAVKTLKKWQVLYPQRTNLTMSVNVSRKQLASPDMLPHLRNVLEQSKISPDRLIIEITESTIMQDPHRSLDVLRQIREMGVQLEVDDFGTGYSSLSCLHSFPLNGLKIDRAFISHVAERRDFAAVVEAILSLARNLNLHVTAEGIETQPQLAMLQSMGCHNAQGFLFGRPKSLADTETFLRDHNQFIVAAA